MDSDIIGGTFRLFFSHRCRSAPVSECLCMCTAVRAMTNRRVNASHHSDKRVSSAHQHSRWKGHNRSHVNTRYKDVKVGTDLDSAWKTSSQKDELTKPALTDFMGKSEQADWLKVAIRKIRLEFSSKNRVWRNYGVEVLSHCLTSHCSFYKMATAVGPSL